jgi:hypothetical protein
MTYRHLLVTALVALLIGTAWAKDEKPVMVDSLVATVGNETVTIEDVHIAREILVRTKTWFSFAEPPVNPSLKLAFRERVSRKLLYAQARKMGFADVSEKNVLAEVAKFRQTFGSKTEYREWLTKYELRDPEVAMDTPDLPRYYPITKWFYRRLAISAYLAKKIEVQVRLGIGEYVETNKADLLKMAPGADEEKLKELAHDELFFKRLKDHLVELEQRNQVVILRDEYL